MNSFKFLEDEATADIAFIAYGDNLNEIFENACLALFQTMIDLPTIRKTLSIVYEIKAEDLIGLLYDLLESLIFKFETEDILLNEFKIDVNPETYSLTVTAYGEKYLPDLHNIKTHIKAITFFGMEFTDESVKVTLDL